MRRIDSKASAAERRLGVYLKLYVLVVLMGVVLAACQDQGAAPPLATVDENGQPPGQARDDRAAQPQERAGQIELSREEVQTLLAGRLALIGFLRQVEGISVPPAEEWTLQEVEELSDGGRAFTLHSGEWSLTLRQPAADEPNLLFHADLSGRDLPSYQADIRLDGSVAPAQ